MRNTLIDHLTGAGFDVISEGHDMTVMEGRKPLGTHKVQIEADTLDALRADYDTLRRFVVSLAEGFVPASTEVQDRSIDALQACSVLYLPPGHSDRSH